MEKKPGKKTAAAKKSTKTTGAKATKNVLSKPSTKKTVKPEQVKKQTRSSQTQTKAQPQPQVQAQEQTQAQAQTQTQAVTAAPSNLSKDERNWAMYCHLSAFAGMIIPFGGNIFGPLLIWLLKREEFPAVNIHGKEALNFQISMSLYFMISFILVFAFIGWLFIAILIAIEFVFIIVASIKAQEGGLYHYPITIRFIK